MFCAKVSSGSRASGPHLPLFPPLPCQQATLSVHYQPRFTSLPFLHRVLTSLGSPPNLDLNAEVLQEKARHVGWKEDGRGSRESADLV